MLRPRIAHIIAIALDRASPFLIRILLSRQIPSRQILSRQLGSLLW